MGPEAEKGFWHVQSKTNSDNKLVIPKSAGEDVLRTQLDKGYNLVTAPSAVKTAPITITEDMVTNATGKEPWFVEGLKDRLSSAAPGTVFKWSQETGVTSKVEEQKKSEWTTVDTGDVPSKYTTNAAPGVNFERKQNTDGTFSYRTLTIPQEKQSRELITKENINDSSKPWAGNINAQGWNNRTEGQEFYWNPETQKIDVEKTDQKVTPITARNWSSIPGAVDPEQLADGESQVQTSDGRIVSSSTKTQPKGNIVLTAGNIKDYPQHQAAFNATRPGETLTLDLGKNTTNKSGSPAKLITFQNEKGDNLQAVEGSAKYNKYVKDPNITMTGTPTNRAPVEYGGFLTEENTASGGKYEQLATVYQKYKDSQYDVSVSNTGNLTLSKNKPDPKSFSRPMTAEERLLPKYAEVLTELPFGAIPILTQDPNYPDHFSVEIKEPKANEFVSIRNQFDKSVQAYHPRDPRLAEKLNSNQGWYPFKHVTDLVAKGDNYTNLSAQANYQYGRSLIGELKDVISANRANVGAVGNVRRTVQSVRGMLGDFAGAFPGVQKAFQESSQGEAFKQELELQRVLNQTSGGELGIEPMVSEYFDEKLSGVPTIAGALVYAYATANKGTSGRITMADIERAEEQIKATSFTSIDDVITSLNKVDQQLQFRIKSAEQIRGGNRPIGKGPRKDKVDRITGNFIPGNMKVLKRQSDGTYK